MRLTNAQPARLGLGLGLGMGLGLGLGMGMGSGWVPRRPQSPVWHDTTERQLVHAAAAGTSRRYSLFGRYRVC